MDLNVRGSLATSLSTSVIAATTCKATTIRTKEHRQIAGAHLTGFHRFLTKTCQDIQGIHHCLLRWVPLVFIDQFHKEPERAQTHKLNGTFTVSRLMAQSL